LPAGMLHADDQLRPVRAPAGALHGDPLRAAGDLQRGSRNGLLPGAGLPATLLPDLRGSCLLQQD